MHSLRYEQILHWINTAALCVNISYPAFAKALCVFAISNWQGWLINLASIHPHQSSLVTAFHTKAADSHHHFAQGNVRLDIPAQTLMHGTSQPFSESLNHPKGYAKSVLLLCCQGSTSNVGSFQGKKQCKLEVKVHHMLRCVSLSLWRAQRNDALCATGW